MQRWPLCVALLAIAALLLVAPGKSAAAPPGEAPIVLLISLDGTRPVDLEKEGLTSLASFAREGAVAQRMIPVFPSNTFPNHVSLITGVNPERHGIVSNVFNDPARGKFSYENDPSWIEAEPLWSILDRHGIASATYHWVGSEGPWRNGRGPVSWVRYRSGVAESSKVKRILEWLDLASAEQPRFICAWFRGADSKGHRHGPDSKQVAASLRAQDAALAELLAGIEERGLWPRLSLLVVSDHGMARVEREVDLGAALAKAGVEARLHGGGGFSIIDVEERERARIVAASLGLEVFYRDEEGSAKLPLDNPRFGSGVVLARPGTSIFRPRYGGSKRVASLVAGALSLRGAHGYDPELPEMGAIFLARGRRVPTARDLGIVGTLDVTPTVLDLLGVPIPEGLSGRPLLAAQAREIGESSPSNVKAGE